MKYVKILVTLLIFVGLAVGGMRLIKKRQEADKKLPPAQKIAIVVKTITPEITEKTLTLPFIANVKNSNEVIINTKFAGKILFIKELGEEVKKGEVVAKIDNSDLEAKLKEIDTKIQTLNKKINAEKITLNNLYKSHIRTKKLLEVKMASIEQYENEKSKIASLKAQIEADKNSIKALIANKKAILSNMNYTTLTSPIDGKISAKFLNKGDLAVTGKPILKISPKEGNYLFLALPKEYKEILYKNKIYKLTPLNTTFNSLKTFKANVNDSTLINGEKVNVKVVEYKGKGLFLPFDAILSLNNKSFIFIPDGNRAKPIEVKIVASGENYVLIDKNITEPIIIAKPDILLKLKGGHPIKIKY